LGPDRDEARDVLVRDRDVEHFVRDETLLGLETETISVRHEVNFYETEARCHEAEKSEAEAE